jgi:hypothetical protein
MNGIKTLSEMSGIPENEVHTIWKQVIENRQRLVNCPGPHLLSIKEGEETKPNKKWVCSICLGEIYNNDKYWYDIGLSHGKKEGKKNG